MLLPMARTGRTALAHIEKNTKTYQIANDEKEIRPEWEWTRPILQKEMQTNQFEATNALDEEGKSPTTDRSSCVVVLDRKIMMNKKYNPERKWASPKYFEEI